MTKRRKLVFGRGLLLSGTSFILHGVALPKLGILPFLLVSLHDRTGIRDSVSFRALTWLVAGRAFSLLKTMSLVLRDFSAQEVEEENLRVN